MSREDILIFNPGPKKPPRRRRNPVYDLSRKFLEFSGLITSSRDIHRISREEQEIIGAHISAIEKILKKYV